MPDAPYLDLYEIIDDGHGTWAVVLGGTNTPVEIDGTPQVGLSIQDADDVAASLEALVRITASRNAEAMNG